MTRCGAVIGGAHRGEVQVVPPLLPPLLGAPGELEPAGGVEHLLHPLHRVTQHCGQLAVSLQSLSAYDHKILSRYTFHFFWYFHCKICDYYILTDTVSIERKAVSIKFICGKKESRYPLLKLDIKESCSYFLLWPLKSKSKSKKHAILLV